MSDEHTADAPAIDASQSSHRPVQGIVGRLRSHEGGLRQFVDAGLLGTCIVMLAAMLGSHQQDTPLTVAAVAFAVALPMLGFGFITASYTADPVPGIDLLAVLMTFSQRIEFVGALAVFVGVIAVVWHLSALAAILLIVTSVIMLLAYSVTPTVVAFNYAKRHSNVSPLP